MIFILNPFLLIFCYLKPQLLLFGNDYLLYFSLCLLIVFKNFTNIMFCQNLLLLGSYLALINYFKVESCYLMLNLLLQLHFILTASIYDFNVTNYLSLNKNIKEIITYFTFDCIAQKMFLLFIANFNNYILNFLYFLVRLVINFLKQYFKVDYFS